MTKVSILMNCYNGEAYLQEAIESVYRQTYQEWEIIFIDNCSTDNSEKIAKSFNDKLRYYRTENNIPLYAARNFGLQFVRGEYLAFLDVDDLWLPDKLAQQILVMEQNNSIYLVHTGYQLLFQETGERKSVVKHFLGKVGFAQLTKSYTVNLQSVMLRFSMLPAHLRLFNDMASMTGDYELFMQVIHEYGDYFINRPLVITRIHGKNWSSLYRENWPKEIEMSNAALIRNLKLNPTEIRSLDLMTAKAHYFLYLHSLQLEKARGAISSFKYGSIKMALFYLATFSRYVSRCLLKLKAGSV